MTAASIRELVDRAFAAGGGAIAYAAIAMIGIGVGLALVLGWAARGGPIRRRLERYEAALDHELRFLLLKTTGARILRIQAGAIAALGVVAAAVGDPFVLVLAPFVAGVPLVVLRKRRDERRVAIEEQLDGWLMVLSNALKAAPSLGEALATSAGLSRPPISEEIDLVLKEVRFGSPIDEALLHMAQRVDSRTLWGAVATLLVGRQTGGDVSRILEESADSLREMARLEGVVKSKTADGRFQAYVLAGLPFALLGAIHFIDPHWLDALGSSALGYLIIGGAATLWVLGFLTARKILAVDL